MECEYCVTSWLHFVPFLHLLAKTVFTGWFGHNGIHDMEISGFYYKNNKYGYVYCTVERMKLCNGFCGVSHPVLRCQAFYFNLFCDATFYVH